MLRVGGSFTIPIPEFSPCQLCFNSIPSALLVARIMHKFSTMPPKPSALTALRDPQAGAPRAPRRTVQYACGALGRAWRNALRTAFSAPRYENLCIVRARAR